MDRYRSARRANPDGECQVGERQVVRRTSFSIQPQFLKGDTRKRRVLDLSAADISDYAARINVRNVVLSNRDVVRAGQRSADAPSAGALAVPHSSQLDCSRA